MHKTPKNASDPLPALTGWRNAIHTLAESDALPPATAAQFVLAHSESAALAGHFIAGPTADVADLMLHADVPDGLFVVIPLPDLKKETV